MNDLSAARIVSTRTATLADALSISECLSELGYGTSPSLVAEKLASLLSSPIDSVFVAPNPSSLDLLGVVSVHLLPLFHAPGHLARLTSLSVRAEAQGQGVGQALVAAAEAWAWSQGSQRIEVTSGDHRPVAHAFYQAIGYSLDERRFVKHSHQRAS